MTLVLVFLGIEKMPMKSGHLTGISSVIDGDTIEIQGQPIRLFGIDAPESTQICRRDGKNYMCGKDAAIALAHIIGLNPVSCRQEDVDSYDRSVAVCFSGEIELNRWMVANGYALAYRKYSSRYIADEEGAKSARLGLWAGTFIKPWDYRHKGR